jgi:enoyl-CoA hydratase
VPPSEAEFAGFEFLRLERPSPAVLQITMDRPERRNAIDARGHAELLRALTLIDEDESTNVAVITGSGGAFSGGGDISEALPADSGERADALHRMYERNVNTVNRLLALQKPLVAAVEGAAVGAGLRLVVLSDISVVAEDATLIDGHARLGVTAGDHSALAWPLLIGMARAKWLLLMSEAISGGDAARMGLVTESVPPGRALDRALEIAGELAAGPQFALRGTKRVLNHWLRLALPAYEHSAALEALNFLHPDGEEGLTAINEHRPPSFPSARDGG